MELYFYLFYIIYSSMILQNAQVLHSLLYLFIHALNI